MSLSRREVLGLGAAAAALPAFARQDAVDPPEPYFTPQEKFRDVSRGNPLPHKLPPEKRVEAGLTRETWKVEVVSDPEHKANIGKPVTLDWDGLMDPMKYIGRSVEQTERFIKEVVDPLREQYKDAIAKLGESGPKV